MEKSIKGDVVVFPFPFSDLSGSKRRPDLVLAKLKGKDLLLCQITSQPTFDSIAITNFDFVAGSLPVNSFIRSAKLFTADQNIIIKKAGHINNIVLQKVIQELITLLNTD